MLAARYDPARKCRAASAAHAIGTGAGCGGHAERRSASSCASSRCTSRRSNSRAPVGPGATTAGVIRPASLHRSTVLTETPARAATSAVLSRSGFAIWQTYAIRHRNCQACANSPFGLFPNDGRAAYFGHMSAHVINLLDFDMADRLRKAREVAGYTRGELAERLSVARQSVNNYEHRRTKPIPAIRKAWAEACGVSDEWLLTGGDSCACTRAYLHNRRSAWGLAA